MVSEHGLSAGSRVATDPVRYGLRAVYTVAGDELGTALFADPPPPPPDPRFEADLDRLAARFQLRPYPWAGSLSTAHSLLHYERFGPGVFRARRGSRPRPAPSLPPAPALRYDVAAVAEAAGDHEAALWDRLLADRAVSRAAYSALAAALPPARPVAQRPPRRPRPPHGGPRRTRRAPPRDRR
jgi:anaerobic magnesium-protoporphyrin IX monomethyl ester cyclase